MRSTMNYSFFFTGAIIAVLLAGCASTSRVTNLSPAYLYGNPAVSSYKSPEADISGYQTFSVFPQSLISEKTEMNEILEKQMLFFLRNQLEAKGYRFVELNENPDFVATINVSSKYETSYVPPQTVTLPQWVPGQSVTTYGTSSGTFNYNTYGSYSSYGWGNYSGSSTSTTYVPRYMTTQTYTRSGYTIGHYYPASGISLYDGKTLERIWLGTGAGTSDNADVRVSSQFVVGHILAELPNASVPSGYEPSGGVLGVVLGIFTNDGNNYVPTIIKVANQSPAKKAGLRDYDMILAVDNTSVVNKTFRDVLSLICGSPGTITRLEVWRTGQKISVDVTRTTRDKIKY
ncbi:MAG: DUF4136 domain-containing protein [Candidatus Omnitrophica bacterium]|nr:DUF4136 domain-containing protein [Candidatus Omnitrophota bacterium]